MVRGRRSIINIVSAVTALALATLALAACSSNKPAAKAGTSSAAAAACTGDPIKVDTFFSQTGPLAIFGSEVPDGAAAAVKAVNATCSLGRPLQVTVCDDQSTPNGSLQCGRDAKTDGALAIIGYCEGAGGSDQGSNAAGLPALYTTAGAAWDNTSDLSYPTAQPPTRMAGVIKAAQALGAKSVMFAAVDVPGAHIQEQVAAKTAAAAGINLETTFFPLATTDFAPIAAGIVAKNPGAITFLMPQGDQFVNALISTGLSVSKTPIILNEGILTPTQKASLGSKIDGLYEIGDVVPPSATTNAGIIQMKNEYAAAGKTFSTSLSIYSVGEWSAVHALVDALTPLGKAKLASLDTASLLAQVKAYGTYKLPTLVPFNLAQPAVPDATEYGSARIFSTYQGVFETKGGVSTQVGTFQDLTKNFSLN